MWLIVFSRLTVQAGQQAEEEVSEGIPEGDRLRKAMQKYAAERYAQKQVCSTSQLS